MPPRHQKTPQFREAKLFHDLDSFAGLEARIAALPTEKDRGDAFEVFAEAYLAIQKTAQAEEVWPFDNMPASTKKRLALDTSGHGKAISRASGPL